MSSKARELREHVEKILEEERVARPYDFSIARNAHQQVVFYVKGIKAKYQFPGSPSDYRAFANARTSIRKVIRTVSGFALSGAPAQRSFLDASGVLPRQSHYVGGRREGAPQYTASVRLR